MMLKRSNRDFADTFRLIADLMEIKGENIYKILAYRKAAESLENLGGDVNDFWRQGKLSDIPGVGKAIAEKIDEMQRTGKIEFLEKLQAEVPPGLAELLQVPDMGPKKAALVWKQAGVTSLVELEQAAREGRLRSLPGMGQKTESRILAGIEALGRRSQRLPLARAWPAAQELLEYLGKVPGVLKVEAAGSLRRRRVTIGDLDLLAAARDPGPLMEAFTQHPQVLQVLSQGEVKASVEFNNRIRVQLWVQPPERWGSALVYATGSKDHNVRLREMAQDRGYSLSDRGFLKEGETEELLCASEEDVYGFFGMPWIPPEMREDRGEIQAALKGKLPRLIERKDLVAELHTHSTWSDGRNTIQQMAQAAIDRGYKILAVTDHSGGLGITGGLTIDQISEQRAEIDAVQQELGDRLRLLQGIEVEIRADGGLDYPDEVLARFDLVIASLHVSLRQPREQVTGRLLNAIRNPHVDIIGHPTGRLIPDREGADLDMDAVFDAAAKSGTALEISAHPNRLDLEDVYSRRAAGMGIPLSLNTDAHRPEEMDLIHYGLSNARRGWITPEQVINAWQPQRLLDWLKQRGA
jgi:DNA polymerase (family X)